MAGKDDDDNNDSELVERHGAGLRDLLSKAPARETDEVEIGKEPPEPPEPDDEELPSRAGRNERRAERNSGRKTALERAAAAEARAKVLEEQLEISRREPARAPAVAVPPAATLEKNRLTQSYQETIDELDKLAAEYDALGTAKRLTPEIDKDMRRRASALDMKKTSIVIDLKSLEEAPRRAQEENTRRLSVKYPDVMANRQALQYAAGEFNKRVAMGEADSEETHDMAMEEARRVILKKETRPSAMTKQRASGMSGGSRGPTVEAPAKLSMPAGSRLYRLAVASYPSMEPNEACQKWANVHGKAYLAKQADRH